MRNSSYLVAALGLAIFGAGSARAADISRPLPPPPRIIQSAPVTDWSGLYLGVQGGYASYTAPFTSPDELTTFGSLSPTGWFGGARIGANAQIGNWVYGAIADISAGDITSTGSFSGSTAIAKVDWLSTIRGRLGFATGQFLFYGTGGLAIAHVNAMVDNLGPSTGPFASVSNTYLGWAAGLGAEMAITRNMTLNAEWIYTDYGSKSYHFVDSGAQTLDAVASLRGSNFLIGLNWYLR